ncbi:MAG TPA: DJ-1/PfpI family protein, partial [Roseimicrobium sp.]|nr:DJ-1/PfpI family protein [Roseimicrobium sp.]
MQTHILCLVDDIYEDLELWYPKIRLEEAGHETHLVAQKAGTYEGKHGYPATADLTLSEVKVNNYCGLLIPGGFMPDKLRRDPVILDLVRDFNDRGKLIAFICHGGWIPISA